MLVLGIASFVIAAIGVVVAVLSFMRIKNDALRYALGSACLLLTLLFSIVGLYAFFNVIKSSTSPGTGNQEVIAVTATSQSESQSTTEDGTSDTSIIVQPNESPSAVSEPVTAPSAVCSGTGSIPPTPEAPPNGCVLIVEWWVPPDPQPCGIIVTHNAVTLPDGAIGTWWFVYPNRPDSHLKEFAKRDLPCEVQDLR